MSDFIGLQISLISNNNIRYVGTLEDINQAQSTVTLKNVQSFGTENRETSEKFIPKSDTIYDEIVFLGTQVKDLRIEDRPPSPVKMPFSDPAIMKANSIPSRYQQPQQPMQQLHNPTPPQNSYNPYMQQPHPQQHSYGLSSVPDQRSYNNNLGYSQQLQGTPTSSAPEPLPSGVPTQNYGTNPNDPSHYNYQQSQQPQPSYQIPPPVQSTNIHAPLSPKKNQPVSSTTASKSVEYATVPPAVPQVTSKILSGYSNKQTSNKQSTKQSNPPGPKPGPTPTQAIPTSTQPVTTSYIAPPTSTPNSTQPTQPSQSKQQQSQQPQQNTSAKKVAPTSYANAAGGSSTKPYSTSTSFQSSNKDYSYSSYSRNNGDSSSFSHRGGPRFRGRGGYRGRGGARSLGANGSLSAKEIAEDFDFQAANSKFDKEKVFLEVAENAEETPASDTKDHIIKNEENSTTNDSSNTDGDSAHAPSLAYNKQSSFFDSLTLGSGTGTARPDRKQERAQNIETFGHARAFGYGNRGRRGGRGRGYGRSRGRGNNRFQQNDVSGDAQTNNDNSASVYSQS